MRKHLPNTFERHENDFYPTISRAPVEALMPHLRSVRQFAEPCAGDGDLVRSLESFGLQCVYQGDISAGQDALALDSYGGVPIITNPPYARRLLKPLLNHFLRVGPVVWLLLWHDWLTNEWAAPFLTHATDIVAIPRIPWLADRGDQVGMANHVWVRFDPLHVAGPIFHPRGRTTHAGKLTCAACFRPFSRGRSDKKYCSPACKQRVYRDRISVTTVTVMEDQTS